MRALQGQYVDGKFLLSEPLPEGLSPCRFILLLEEPRRTAAQPAATSEIPMIAPTGDGWLDAPIETALRDDEDWGSELDSLRLPRHT